MRAVVVACLALAAFAACSDRHHHRRPSQVPTGDEWRVPAEDRDAGPRPAPSAQPASGEEIHI
jgi:hypothetical protein